MKMAIVHIPAQIVIKMNIIDLGINGIRSGVQKGLEARNGLKYLYTNNIRYIGTMYSSIDDTRLVYNNIKEGSTMVIPRNRGVPATKLGRKSRRVIGKVVLLQKYGVDLV